MKRKQTQTALARLARKLARADPFDRLRAGPFDKLGAGPFDGFSAGRGEVAGAESRRARGLRLIGEIAGTEGAEALDGLVELSPGLTRDIVDFAYGDVIAQGKMDARTRALVVVGALAALGHARPQLKVHIGSAINSGCTQGEIIETLRLVALYAGFPAAMNAVGAAREAFAGRQPRSTRPKRPRPRRTV
jgi:4-carboxymuconolactone decarboxylase